LTAHPTGLKPTLAKVPVVCAPKTPPAAVMSPVTNGALAWKVSSIVIVTPRGGVPPASGADANAATDATASPATPIPPPPRSSSHR
jgi:hypothetical protein